jgi:uncharacterized secreted protein with C-terminal beta-propeller domain
MNESRTALRAHVVLPLISLLALAACGGSSSSTTGPEPPVAGLLKQVSAPAELEVAIKNALTTVTPVSTDVLATAGAAPAPEADFTGTYTQEQNVDEFDAVRYDGEHLYVAPRRFFNCCFALPEAQADGAANTGIPASASIRMLATDPANAAASVAGIIPLDDNVSVQGMYVDGNRLFALTAELFYGTYGDAWSSLAIWAPETLGFTIYDLADKATPVKAVDVSMDGVFVDSRRIGNIVYIVSRYAPNIPDLIYNPQSADEQAQNQSLLANVTLDELLPTITIDGVSQPLVDPANCFISNDDRIPDYPVITSVTAVPIDNPEGFVNTCLNDDVYGVYVSEAAIYFPQVLGYLLPDDVETRIHKFSLAGASMNYRGSADIEGQVWRGGQADFRMSEHNGDLRVLSSEFNMNSTDFVDHLLYILRESPTEPALDIVGSLPNASRPDPIGKPNEQLYGVRFLGDRAYAVTFMQIDPLYVFDLADPADPLIAGELEVTGFSDFLHPVTDELLLGLGTAATGGVKLELFDVSDLSAPLSRGAVTIGEPNAYSEARWDRHAFTYQPDVAGLDRFTVPATIFSDVNGQFQAETSLHLFEIHDKLTPALASLVPVGQLAPPVTSEFGYGVRNRAFLHDDTIYYVLDETVWSAFWLSPTMVNGPF